MEEQIGMQMFGFPQAVAKTVNLQRLSKTAEMFKIFKKLELHWKQQEFGMRVRLHLFLEPLSECN